MQIYSINKLNELPNQSGVYFLWSKNELLYIGKSKDIKKRILQHLSYGLVVQHIVNPEEIKMFSIIHTKDEFDAERIEKQLLGLISTKYNKNWFCNYERYWEWKFMGLPSIDVELYEKMEKVNINNDF